MAPEPDTEELRAQVQKLSEAVANLTKFLATKPGETQPNSISSAAPDKEVVEGQSDADHRNNQREETIYAKLPRFMLESQALDPNTAISGVFRGRDILREDLLERESSSLDETTTIWVLYELKDGHPRHQDGSAILPGRDEYVPPWEATMGTIIKIHSRKAEPVHMKSWLYDVEGWRYLDPFAMQQYIAHAKQRGTAPSSDSLAFMREFAAPQTFFHKATVKVPPTSSAILRLALEMEFRLRYWQQKAETAYFVAADSWVLERDTGSVQRKIRVSGREIERISDVFEERLFVRLEIPHETLGSTQSAFTLSVLEDGVGTDPPPTSIERWAKYCGLLPCDGAAIGIVQFLVVLLAQVEVWNVNWEESLDMVERHCRLPMKNLSDNQQLGKLMYDRSFDQSTSNFVAIQLLRTASRYIDDARLSALSLKERFDVLNRRYDEGRSLGLSPDIWAKVMRNVGYTSDSIQEKSARLLDRIRQNSEEVKSLQDGLFSTTSLREANRGMVLNRAIYVFTVVTVIYTPLGVMAAFWALPFLVPGENDDGTTNMPDKFVSTMVGVPVVTYALALLAAIYIGSERVRSVVKKVARPFLNLLYDILSSIALEVDFLASILFTLTLKIQWARLRLASYVTHNLGKKNSGHNQEGGAEGGVRDDTPGTDGSGVELEARGAESHDLSPVTQRLDGVSIDGQATGTSGGTIDAGHGQPR